MIERTALLIIDVQNGLFAIKNFHIGVYYVDDLIDFIKRKIEN
ncbi:MAG: hypothetical protein ACFE9C_01600 [Candidatus Hodarchaeota archaeon]